MTGRLSEKSTAVLNVLLNAGPCTPAQLRTQLPSIATRSISKACNNLKNHGYLDCQTTDGQKYWVALQTRVRPVKKAPAPVQAHEGEPLVITPPRQYDVMRAPVWVPPASTHALRPGATDALRVASFGVRC